MPQPFERNGRIEPLSCFEEMPVAPFEVAERLFVTELVAVKQTDAESDLSFQIVVVRLADMGLRVEQSLRRTDFVAAVVVYPSQIVVCRGFFVGSIPALVVADRDPDQRVVGAEDAVFVQRLRVEQSVLGSGGGAFEVFGAEGPKQCQCPGRFVAHQRTRVVENEIGFALPAA